MVGESRTELLQWLNSTLGLTYNRVEQCGTGAAYCQIIDSIYGDVPMGKIKFNASNEYDYRHNLKILQTVFTKHKIAKTVEVERLIKCRLQDNLELLQWMKKFWTENKDINVPYDAPARRRVTSGPSSNIRSRAPSRAPSGPRRVVSAGTSVVPGSVPGSVSGTISGRTTPIYSGHMSQELANKSHELEATLEELKDYKISVTSLQAERNFYFNKLREIEVLCETAKNSDTQTPTSELIAEIQAILYKTEEGFEAEDGDEF
ncbi:hypothetical protein PGUG_00523 [Meyerozyma guilliermondii ATCC 6260]|uniref:Uncharacterized protein n=1 Tax=Meyerozyma guilliermondii (strain ATCC 6260 / CBS 566 / DSM 6381 / JCM 1539 / NBRC 10279 / NRRL Y-324) TaxID=294746 RepID=A5DB68_PICGU|nr:uncharacterized protein PGUG_00523 [Meyerozyma guilliermondii ATCC 6260]EDK36425.2 hypothetical protein PGUG_00523 [Meyerozyma guilliermondii ATCC 6260]